MSNEIVKKVFVQDPLTLLRDSFSNLEPEYKEEYIGKIVDNKDPEKQGRCRVNVFGLFDSVDDDLLPWAIPDFGFVGSEVGSFIVPPVGCIVRVRFDQGNICFPIYSSKVINVGKLPKNATKDYPDTMVFFETDKGSSFEINRKTDETTFKHFSGTEVIIDTAGNVKFKTVANYDNNHTGFYTDNGMAVVPSGQGAFNCLVMCPLANITHAGNRIVGGV